jgi:predicted homoserine dehydrogenase-like protein
VPHECLSSEAIGHKGDRGVEEIRVGLIGHGMLGAVHAASMSMIPGCRLVAASKASASVATAGAGDGIIIDAEASATEGSSMQS